MNIQQIEFSKEDARVALLEYKKHRGVYDQNDWEIERVYRAIARGGKVISVATAIQRAGLDAINRPVELAVLRATQ